MSRFFANGKNRSLSPDFGLLQQAMAYSPERLSIYRLDPQTHEFELVYENKLSDSNEPKMDKQKLDEFLDSSLVSTKPYRKKLEWDLDTDKYQAWEWTGVAFDEKFVLLQQRSVTISSIELDLMRQEISSDWLTRILNRQGLNEFLEKNLNDFEGDFLFGIFDLNDFKLINDSYGHLAGDKVLREIARVTTEWLEPNGIVARVGGDEFAFFQPIAAKTNQQSLQDLKSAIAKGDYPRHCSELVDVAIGAVSGTGKGFKTSQLWAESDRLMYRAKKSKQQYLLRML